MNSREISRIRSGLFSLEKSIMYQPKVMRANGTVYPSRFVAIDASDNNSVLQANAGQRTFGVSSEGGREAPVPSLSTVYAAIAGDDLQVYSMGQTCLLELGAACLAGYRLKPDSNGKGVPIAGTPAIIEFFGAEALEAGSAGDFVKVLVLGPMSQSIPSGGTSSSG